MKKYLSICQKIGRQSQRKVKGMYGKKFWVKEIGRGAGGDRTMRADKHFEDVVLKGVKELGDFYLISEEFGEKQFGQGGPKVIVDPIDGSKNFKRGIGHFGISIAFADGDTLGDVNFGYIKDLSLGNEYWAIKGRGAYKNGKKIKTAKGKSIDVFGMDFAKGPFNPKLTKLIKSLGSARDLGSIAVSMAFFSEGLFDAYAVMKGETRVLDAAAGYLIAKEAGGIFQDFKNKDIKKTPLSLNSSLSFFVASNKSTASRVRAVLKNK